MDAREIQNVVKSLEKATDATDTLNLLNRLKKEVVATEELLRSTKVGHMVNRKKQHPDANVKRLASEIVSKWRADVSKAKSGGNTSSGKASSMASPNGAAGASPPKNNGPEPQITVPLPDRTFKKDSVDVNRTADPKRNACIGLLYNALAPNSPDSPLVVIKLSGDIERACGTEFGFNTPKYQEKMRSLYQNLRSKSNPGLRRRVLAGEFTPEQFVKMPAADMLSAERRAEDANLQKENMNKAMVAKPERAKSNTLQCGKCKKKDVWYTQAQTRSADEPMTTFCECNNCEHRWKFC